MCMIAKSIKLLSLFFVAGLMGMGTAMAQNDTEVSDEELQAYIIVMDSVDVLRAQLSEDVSALIVNHEQMDGGRKYSKIKAVYGDPVEMEEAGFTEEEVKAFEELQAQVEEMQAELNAAFSAMVKEHVGVAEYNKIRKGLRSDEELKARHEALSEEMHKEDEDAEAGEGEPEQEAAGNGLQDDTSN